MTYPSLHVLPGHDRRLRGGSPWIYSNELRLDAEAKALPPGTIARLVVPDGKTLGVVHFNPHSLIAGRLLSRNKDATIDTAFLERRIRRAVELRDRMYEAPYYRAVHAEADGLPGLVIDRFGDCVVIQCNTAGMQALEAELVAVVRRVIKPTSIVMRGDAPIRQLEGLEIDTRVVLGEVGGPVTVDEDGIPFLADVVGGQKTGWYYDQRDNRGFAARFAKGQRVLDLYCHGGGFGLQAAAAGATSVLGVDSSKLALDLAVASADLQGKSAVASFDKQDVYAAIDGLTSAKERFGLVVADPPAFVRSKKDLKPGLKGYRKLARGAANLVAESGVFAVACCSHNVEGDAFAEEIYGGIRESGRGAKLLHRAGAAPDHPIHPALPESAYLKFLVYALD